MVAALGDESVALHGKDQSQEWDRYCLRRSSRNDVKRVELSIRLHPPIRNRGDDMMSAISGKHLNGDRYDPP